MSKAILGAWCAVVLVAGAAAAAVHDNSPKTTSGARATSSNAASNAASSAASITTSTLPPSPPRLLFSVRSIDEATATTHSIDLSGTDERPEALAPVQLGQVSPDGKRVVFDKGDSRQFSNCGFAGCSTTNTLSGDIVIANRDGSNEQPVTHGGYNRGARWSSQDVIAFVAHLEDANHIEHDEIELIRASGVLVGVVPPQEQTVPEDPEFSPDGNQLAYVLASTQDASRTLHVFDLVAATDRELAGGAFSGLHWSPDGTQLVGVRPHTRDWPNPDELVVVPVNGEPLRVVYKADSRPPSALHYVCGGSQEGYAQLADPIWSPDGATIGFLTNVEHIDFDGAVLDVAVIAADGSNPHTVRPTARTECTGPNGSRSYETLHLLGWA
jgi:hypothetical protein